MNPVRDKLKIWKLEHDRKIVKEQFCEEHQCDIESLVNMVDSMLAGAVACGNSPHAYVELQRERMQFINYMLEISKKYRVVAD